MRMTKWLALAFIMSWTTLGRAVPATDSWSFPTPRELSLAGEWEYHIAQEGAQLSDPPAQDDFSWRPLEVPANWHLAGLDLEGSIWFRRRFHVPASAKGTFGELVFEGVDYAAEVWLNGQRLGFHEGYFEPFRFDASSSLLYPGENTLLVLVTSPHEEVGPVWSLHKKLIKGVFGQHDTRPGGAWSPRGQEQNTGGIWAPVYLRFSQRVILESLHATPHPLGAGELRAEGEPWQLQVELSVHNPGRAPMDVEVDLDLAPLNFLPSLPTGNTLRTTAHLQPGANRLKFTLECPNTQLWWSWDRGLPNLYQVQVVLRSEGQLLDEAKKVVGFRTIGVMPGNKEWRLNGKRIFLRGTNYISTQWMSEMDAEKYSFDLSLMKRANINAVRVHAHIEAQPFYQACDEAGLLIWQDFALQWGYSEDAVFETEAVRQALGMVELLRDHPSVIGWTLHNEPPWDAAWMQYKYKDYDPQQNKRLDEMLWRAVSEADPTRYAHEHSGTAEHPWLGWYSGSWRDYGNAVHEPFITEFGAQALPDLPALERIFGPGDIWPDTAAKWEEWDYHNFEKHEAFDIAHVSMGTSLPEFVSNTQQYQAKVVQFAAESYRRQRFQPVTAIFQFMFVEDWPSVNWGIVDYWRNLKPGYSALATAYQLVLPSIDLQRESWTEGERVKLDLWVINDKEEAYPGSRLVMDLHRDNLTLQSQALEIDIASDSARKLSTVSWPRLAPGSYEFIVQIEDSHGAVLGKNRSSFRVVAAGGS
jgi:beta-mannosidase